MVKKWPWHAKRNLWEYPLQVLPRVYEKVVGGGRRDPLQRVRAHDVPMGGWEWCNEARYGRPLDASPLALRSACLLASNFFIPPWCAGGRIRCRQANRRSKGLAGVSRERRGRASLHHPWAPRRHALVADALKLVPTHVRRFLANNFFIHPAPTDHASRREHGSHLLDVFPGVSKP